jgi:hypothetical protein
MNAITPHDGSTRARRAMVASMSALVHHHQSTDDSIERSDRRIHQVCDLEVNARQRGPSSGGGLDLCGITITPRDTAGWA